MVGESGAGVVRDEGIRDFEQGGGADTEHSLDPAVCQFRDPNTTSRAFEPGSIAVSRLVDHGASVVRIDREIAIGLRSRSRLSDAGSLSATGGSVERHLVGRHLVNALQNVNLSQRWLSSFGPKSGPCEVRGTGPTR